jgi:hypothetical protein
MNQLAMRAVPTVRLGLALLILTLLAAIASAQEAVSPGQTLTLVDAKVVVYVASGTATLHRAEGRGLTIRATAEGADADELGFFTDREGDAARFRVDFPGNDRIAGPPGTSGTTTVRLRDDGTFGGDDNSSWWRGNRGRGDEVEIGGTRGLRAWATLDIGVPEGVDLTVRLAVGHARVTGVTGTVMIDTWGADAEAEGIAGSWLFDTGSGNVTVRNAGGTLRIDTGSGSGTVTGMRGDLLDIDTGSGSVDATDVQVGRFRFDTGSGDVRSRNLSAPRGVADTGSGSVLLEYAEGAVVEDLLIDTGSGSVQLALPRQVSARLSIDTGSGEVTVNREGAIFERRNDDGTVLRFGEGANRIRIDTGSGGVTIR